jgi:hypothetical protein
MYCTPIDTVPLTDPTSFLRRQRTRSPLSYYCHEINATLDQILTTARHSRIKHYNLIFIDLVTFSLHNNRVNRVNNPSVTCFE